MVFLQVILFRKPWRYCCNKARSAAHRHCLASLARGGILFLQVYCPKTLALLLKQSTK